jgi:hypothetical protein
MVKNGNGCKNARISLVAATFEKANTYVFAAPIIRDREVGGSNPLAPTNNSYWINNLGPRVFTPFFFVWPICGQNFSIHELTAISTVTICKIPPKN